MFTEYLITELVLSFTDDLFINVFLKKNNKAYFVVKVGHRVVGKQINKNCFLLFHKKKIKFVSWWAEENCFYIICKIKRSARGRCNACELLPPAGIELCAEWRLTWHGPVLAYNSHQLGYSSAETANGLHSCSVHLHSLRIKSFISSKYTLRLYILAPVYGRCGTKQCQSEGYLPLPRNYPHPLLLPPPGCWQGQPGSEQWTVNSTLELCFM